MLTPQLLGELRTEEGRELLERAAQMAEDPFAVEKLRQHASFELASAAVEQVRLRKRAASRFSRSGEMWFAPGLLEQASGEEVSRHRARRFGARARDAVADLCCGLGGDALSLAAWARVIAVDRDPLALALAEANAETLGLAGRIEVRLGTLPDDAPELPAAWIDPGRREEGRRTRRLDRISPSIAETLSLRGRIPHLGIKLSPASDDAELDAALAGVPHEREFLSVRGECRELAVWTGDLAGNAPVRATLLSAGAELAGEPAPYGEVRPLSEWLLEPDPAVIRAGLVGNLAETLDAWPIDPKLAYLALPARRETPFGVLYRVGAAEPFSARALADRLRRLGAEDAIIKTRGAAVDPEALRHQLRGVLKQGKAGCCSVVFLTRLGGRPQMILGDRLGPGVE